MNMNMTPKESAWRIVYGLPLYGLCYTLNISFDMAIYASNGTINIGLQDLSYYMVAHDPSIFLHSSNPSIPQLWSMIENENKLTLQKLIVVERRNLV